MKPTRKVGAAGIGGAIAILTVFIAGQFGLEVPGEVGTAFGTVVSFVAGWFTAE